MATEEAGLDLFIEGDSAFNATLEKLNETLSELTNAVSVLSAIMDGTGASIDNLSENLDSLSASAEADTSSIESVGESAGDADESVLGLGESAEAASEGLDDSASSTAEADTALSEFANTASDTQGVFDAASEIIIGALRKIGEIAVESLLAAGQAMIGFVNDSFTGAIESDEALASLNSTIKATGGVAGVTADAALDLATGLSQVTKFSDDSVTEAETLLLTFTNIGNKVFPRATETLLDMATIMKTDAKSGAIQLGKALNDPVEGMSALSRVGVTFTDEQKKLIGTLVKTGDVAGAQTVILDELQREFGGAARAAGETFSGKLEILKNRFGEVGEGIASAFLPALDSLLDKSEPILVVIEDLSGAAGAFISTLLETGDITEAIDSLGEFESVRVIFDALGISGTDFYKTSGQIGDAFERIGEAARDMFAMFQAGEDPIDILSTAIGDLFGPEVGARAGQFFESLKPGIAWAVENFPVFRAKVLEIGDAIQSGLGSAMDWFLANWPLIQSTTEAVFNGVRDIVTTVVGEVSSFAVDEFSKIKDWTDENWPLIESTVSIVVSAISDIVTSVISAVTDFWGEHGDTILNMARATWENIKISIDNTITAVLGIIKAVMQIINGDWSGAWNTIKTTAETIWENIKTQISNAINAVWPIIDGVLQTIRSGWEQIWSGIQSFVSAKMEEIRQAIEEKINAAKTAIENAVKSIKSAIEDNVTAAATAFSNAIEAIKKAAEPVGTYINNLLDSFKSFYNWLNTHVFTFSIELPELPDWAIPGSPTPFEMGLRGIADALKDVSLKSVDFSQSMNFLPGEMPISPAASAGQMMAQSINNASTSNSLTINANYPMQSQRSVSDDLRLWSMLTGNA